MISRLIRWFGLKPETEDTEPSSRITALGNQIGYDIPKEYQALFKRALRHRSIVDHETYQSHETYERLEFLGDAVLDLIITEILFDKYPRKDEGFLTKLRAKIVQDRKSTRLNSSHVAISYAVFCFKKKKN